MNSRTDLQLLRDYAERRSEAAFAELVSRHVDLVYSAAVRMVCDSHLAEDVTQGAFVALARSAHQLTGRPVLSGWLHRTAQNIAAQTVRTEVRRRAREQEAAVMNELLANETEAAWEHVAPHLDAALGEMSEADRDALLLRYFERKSAQDMANILGVSDEAAQKRVSRAVERLREFLTKRGVNFGASGLGVAIAANAVHAAPVGLALTISTAAVVGGTSVATATATATKAIAMTTLQKTLIVAVLAASVGTGIYEAHQASTLRRQVQTAVPLADQILKLTAERDEALGRLAALRESNDPMSLRAEHSELLKLRGEVTRLRDECNDLQRLRSEGASGAGKDPKIAFQHRFLARSTWTNAGLLTPAQSLETFLWAWTSKDEAAILQASARDTNGQPIRLTGMSTDYQDRLMGAQVLSFSGQPPNLDALNATIVTEVINQMEDQNGRSYEGTNHGILRLRFVKADGEWRFAGRF